MRWMKQVWCRHGFELVLGLLIVFLVVIGFSHAQQPQLSPEDDLAREQGKNFAAQRAREGAENAAGELAVALQRAQKQVAAMTTEVKTLGAERDTLKAEVAALKPKVSAVDVPAGTN